MVVSTVAGLIIAADSRLGLTNANWTIACDNTFKIAEVEGVDRTVVFTTGYSTVWALAGVQTDKICEHVASNKPKFDAQAILANAARRAGASLTDIAQEVVHATAAYIASHPTDYETRIGQFLFFSRLLRVSVRRPARSAAASAEAKIGEAFGAPAGRHHHCAV
ncbi:hypothetical protein [Bradyrhizobium sp. CCBAU 65884]|uniref:hypothetical protein n=1 Tax=Bradyrhizobium sp. CCBAU 65884 TaxID=722477 RepID=UPI0023051390|nr:hypothetical protein [Bradyrhizobium sp. CCBAU 65884]